VGFFKKLKKKIKKVVKKVGKTIKKVTKKVLPIAAGAAAVAVGGGIAGASTNLGISSAITSNLPSALTGILGSPNPLVAGANALPNIGGFDFGSFLGSLIQSSQSGAKPLQPPPALENFPPPAPELPPAPIQSGTLIGADAAKYIPWLIAGAGALLVVVLVARRK
jgi:hypothetical protein